MSRRGLGGSSAKLYHFSDYHIRIQRSLTVAAAIISIVSAMITFYWFSKMRRSFRHDLIMLLILSDLFKAVWYLLYPIFIFTQDLDSSSSAWCQVSGFFLQDGIIASDYSILMIAIHAALCIFRSTVAVGEGGLYRYRHIVYGGWALYPLLLASLAFTNPKSPYISSGTYCVLPVRPFFYRLGLSWIPRYIIFGTILGIYASIYIYAKRKFRDSESGHSGSRVTISANDHASLNDASSPGQLIPLPTAPVLARHGLIRGESEDNINLESRKLSAATTISLPVQPTLIVSNSRKVQVPKADDSSSALRRKHRAVKRQLRFLFIYPLVYMLLWVVPFVNHCLQYSNYFARNPPFILNCFVTVIVALQCAADCLLFSIREKPWRYIAGSQGTFLNSFAFWTHGKEEEHAERLIRFPWRTIKGEGAMVGLGKDKMTAEADVALIRKNNERRALMLEKDEVERKRKDSVMKRGGRQERNWWEQERKLRGHDSIVDSEVENGERSHAVEMQILRPLEKDTSIGTRMELRECL